MNYKITIQDKFIVWRVKKTVYLSGVDAILKPSLLDDNYTFLDKDKNIVYSTPNLNVISIQLIDNKKENEDE